MKIAFLGTPDFALPSLSMLIENNFNIVGVFTQPDRPAGRSSQLVPPPVKTLALKHSLPVFQCEKIKQDGAQILRNLAPDLMITVAFGQILSQENLAVPALGCINVHGSLLPKYRGAAPIQWAIINGEKVTGITTMMTDVGLDTGDILLQSALEIGCDETAGDLFKRLSVLGAQTLKQTLVELLSGKLMRIPQNESHASYFPMLKKQDGHIDFTKSAQSIVNLIRGTDPWPGAYALKEDNAIKILKAKTVDENVSPCKVVVTKNGFIVGTGNGCVEVLEVQPAGKGRMSAAQYVMGRQIKTGDILI